tara:strand:- start:282 stop:467 length:186 start_codon:yes stop_codon:yes gene_type:complete
MTRPDPMIPCKPGAEDVVAMRNRVRWIEALYEHDGRENSDHPMHGLYTGLHIKYANWVGNH